MLLAGGGVHGHGTASACVAAPGGAGAAVAGEGAEDAYGRRGERDTRFCSWGGGEGDMGRRWRAWWRLGEQERWQGGPGWSWWRLGERERCEGAAEAQWRCRERERPEWVRRFGGEEGAPPFAEPGLVAGRAWPVRGRWRVLGDPAWCCLVLGGVGGGVPHPPLICRGGCAGGGGWWYASSDCPGWGWAQRAPFGVHVVAGRIRFLVWGGWHLVVGGE